MSNVNTKELHDDMLKAMNAVNTAVTGNQKKGIELRNIGIKALDSLGNVEGLQFMADVGAEYVAKKVAALPNGTLPSATEDRAAYDIARNPIADPFKTLNRLLVERKSEYQIRPVFKAGAYGAKVVKMAKREAKSELQKAVEAIAKVKPTKTNAEELLEAVNGTGIALAVIREWLDAQ